MLAWQGCDTVIFNAAIYSLCNVLCSDDGYEEWFKEERGYKLGGNDSQLVAKRYNTRGYRYDYTTYLKLNMNSENGHVNEVIEEIIDVMPTFNGLLNTLRDLYLVSYPRKLKYYTSFSFSDKSTLVMKKDDMHTMSSTAFVSVWMIEWLVSQQPIELSKI